VAGVTRLRALSGAAAAGSAVVLAAALAFQYLGGLAPCPMCIWQRWPHVAAVALGLAALALGWRAAAALGAVAMLVGAGLGLFHAGVEQGWWEGPSTCAAGPVGGLSTEELLAQILNAPLVRCDEIAWSFAGVSMAGWNAILSLALAALFAGAYASSSASQYR
jgi:disulfide bond formation protein DsbB